MSTELIKVSVCKMTEVDDFENGCQLKGGQDFGVIETFTVKSMDEALKKLKDEYGEPAIFEDRIEIQRTENAEGYEASPNEIERWKKNEIKLWLANYSCYFYEVRTKKIDGNALHAFFPSLEVL